MRESKYEIEVVERKKVLFPSSPNPDFREVHAELSRNFRKTLRYNPGFPASATYDRMMAAIVWKLGYVKTFARKKYIRGRISLSMLAALLFKFPCTDLSVNTHIQDP